VLVCRGGKTTKPRVMWKAHDAAGRLRDRDLELNDGYPSRAEVTLMDSNHRPLLQPLVLDIIESAGGLVLITWQGTPNRAASDLTENDPSEGRLWGLVTSLGTTHQC
jgi:hypothetical protein